MSKKLKISASDWMRIGLELYKNDSKFAEQAKKDGLTKEAGLGSWLQGKGWSPNKVTFESMQNNLKNQNDLIKLHTFINQNPGIMQLVPRLKEVQSDIAKAVAKSTERQNYVKAVLAQEKAAEEKAAAAAGATAQNTELMAAMNSMTGTGEQPAAAAVAAAPVATTPAGASAAIPTAQNLRAS